MKREYYDYRDWEDYRNGMYSGLHTPCKKALSRELLSSSDAFLREGRKMVLSWPIASKENLTNPSCNRCAWVGQATCSYKHQSSEIDTRNAWSEISPEQRKKANHIASIIIVEFLKNHNPNHSAQGPAIATCIGGFFSAIDAYITGWESRCYSEGIPDYVCDRLYQLNRVPSYRRIANAILTNDVRAIGGRVKRSLWYSHFKREELLRRGVKIGKTDPGDVAGQQSLF